MKTTNSRCAIVLTVLSVMLLAAPAAWGQDWTTYNGEDAYLAFIRDITEKKRNAERLEAIYQQAVQLSSALTIQKVSEKTLDIMETVFEYQTITFHVVDGSQLRTLG